jgi:hypothetical protein
MRAEIYININTRKSSASTTKTEVSKCSLPKVLHKNENLLKKEVIETRNNKFVVPCNMLSKNLHTNVNMIKYY